MTHKLSILQKRVIRIVNKVKYREHTNPLFLKLKALKFKEIIEQNIAILLFKAYKKVLPINVQKMFVINNELHSYNTRQHLNFHHQFASTSAKQHTIKIKGPKIWNDLPEVLKHVNNFKSILSFKVKLKKYLLSKYV